MDLTQDREVHGGFTKVPNSLTKPDHPLWQYPGAMQLYMQLLSVCPRKGVSDQQHLANILGIKLATLRKNLARLRKSGYVQGDLTLMVDPDQTVQPQALTSIAEELKAQPRRKPDGITRVERWEKIKEAWNTQKPKQYMQLDGSVNLPLLLAIETHTKRLKHDRSDYKGFIGLVLKGAENDEWWADKNIKASALFGMGSDLKDLKFQNVEKLYRAGILAQSQPSQHPEINWSDDKQVIFAAHLKSKGREYTEVDRVSVDESSAKYLGQRILYERQAVAGWVAPDDSTLMRLRNATARVEFKSEWYDERLLVLVYSGTNEEPSDWSAPRQADNTMIKRIPSAK